MAELTRKQKIYVALLVAVVGAVSSVLTGISQSLLSSTLEAPRLKQETGALKDELAKKTAALQKLETEFVPFKTLALQYFTGTEAERVSKLAMKLQDLESGYLALADKEKATSEKTVAIEKKLSQRHLTDEQRKTFIHSLSGLPVGKIGVSYGTDARETITFANEIAALLKEAGFEIPPDNGMMYAVGVLLPTPDPWNLAVVWQPQQTPAIVAPIQRAFAEIGVELKGYLDDAKRLSYGGPSVQIYIGSK